MTFNQLEKEIPIGHYYLNLHLGKCYNLNNQKPIRDVGIKQKKI